MTHAKRVDDNQADIVEGLRAAGCTVLDLSGVGHGCPDLLIGYHGRNYLFEVKTEQGKLNLMQEVWHSRWTGSVKIIRSLDEALEALDDTL